MSAATCPHCGAPAAPGARICGNCGMLLRAAGLSPSFRTNVYMHQRPLELWIVIALFAIPGIYLVQATLRAFPDVFDLWDVGLFGHRFVFFLIIILVYVLALGLAFCAVAYMLYRLDPVGRGLAYVLVAADVTFVIFGDGTSTGDVLTMLVALAAAAVLAFAPAVRPLFSAQRHGQPNSVVTAKVVMAVWVALLALTALLYLLLYDVNAKYPVIAFFFIALGGGLVYVYRQLGLADRRARVAITIAAGVAIILYLAGSHESGVVLLIGLTAAVPILLWLPPDARAFYGYPPINWNVAPMPPTPAPATATASAAPATAAAAPPTPEPPQAPTAAPGPPASPRAPAAAQPEQAPAVAEEPEPPVAEDVAAEPEPPPVEEEPRTSVIAPPPPARKSTKRAEQFCGNCGSQRAEGKRFCTECGQAFGG